MATAKEKREKRKAAKKRNKERSKARAEEARLLEEAELGEPSRRTGLLRKSASEMLLDYDYMIVLLVTGLVVFGVIMVFSAGYYSTLSLSKPDPYYFLKRQGFFAVTGMLLMWLFSKLDYHIFASRKVMYLLLVLSFGFLIALMAGLGENVNGAVRYMNIAGVRITPSEMSKLAIIMFTAGFLAEKPSRIRSFGGVLFLFIVMGAHAALILMQPNLSTAIVICAIMIGMMIVAGLRLWYLLGIGAAGAAGVYYILNYLPPEHHWYRRITNFVDPFMDAQGEGYQVVQSLIALGNGGIKGLGLGNSVAKNLYLPEPQNDFILAIIGEELGYIGIIIMMIAFLLLIWRCFTVAANAADKMGFFTASGIGIMLALHVIINIAVVTSSMPATGITLPFISYGGTSLWIFLIAIGILLNVSKRRTTK